jgi:hypothetical protein
LKIALRDQEAHLAASNPLQQAAAHFPGILISQLTLRREMTRWRAVSLRRIAFSSTEVEMTIDLKTPTAIGLTVPLTVMTGADEVIE